MNMELQWNYDSKLSPKTFSEMALNPEMREHLELYFLKGFVALLFVGDVGTGKTTCANIFKEKFKKDGGIIHPIKCSDFDGTGGSKKFEKEVINKAKQMTIFSQQKLFVLEEAHFLPASCAKRLNIAIQEGVPHSSWILCVNNLDAVSDAVIDRCKAVVFPIVKEHPETGELLFGDMFGMTEQEWKDQLRHVGECYAEKKGISIPDTVYEKVFSQKRYLLSTRKFVEALETRYNLWEMSQT
jgi:hypothetical protein